MSRPQRETAAPWQEVAIEEFETISDTNAFEAMLADYTVRDRVQASVGRVDVSVDMLPDEITESHSFPQRFAIERFEAQFTDTTINTDDHLWSISADYIVNGQPYRMATSEHGTILWTENYEGGELRYEFSPDMATRFLGSIAAIQVGLDIDALRTLYEQHEPVKTQEATHNILRLLGNRDESALYLRERTAWLPLLAEKRALLVRFSEMESSARSGRKLSYKMGWQIGEETTEIGSAQREFSLHGSNSPLVSQRATTDIVPGELLFWDQLSDQVKAGEYIDPDTDRTQYACVANSIKRVLDFYLAPYFHLDRAPQADKNPEITPET